MKLLFMTAIVFLSSCKSVNGIINEADSDKPTSDKIVPLGWYHGNCIATDISMTPADDIILVNKEQRKLKASVVGVASEQSCFALTEGRAEVNRAEGYRFFEVSVKDETFLAEELGIVIIGPSLHNSERLDINHNKRKDVFDYCITAEGVRFYAWDGEKGRRHPFWQGYYYMGYDIEDDCDF